MDLGLSKNRIHPITKQTQKKIMVVYVLSLKAELENVASLQLLPTQLCLSVRNPVDASDVRERIVVDTSAVHEAADDHAKHKKHHPKHEYPEAPCHFALKWDRADTNRATLRVVPHPHEGVATELTTSGVFVPLLALECDGMEPYDFHPLGDEIAVTNTSGQEFRPDLSSKNWKEFELSAGTTAVSNLQVQFS